MAAVFQGSVQTLVKHYEDHAAVVQKDTNEKCAQIKEEEISQKQAYATKMQSIIKRQVSPIYERQLAAQQLPLEPIPERARACACSKTSCGLSKRKARARRW